MQNLLTWAKETSNSILGPHNVSPLITFPCSPIRSNPPLSENTSGTRQRFSSRKAWSEPSFPTPTWVWESRTSLPHGVRKPLHSSWLKSLICQNFLGKAKKKAKPNQTKKPKSHKSYKQITAHWEKVLHRRSFLSRVYLLNLSLDSTSSLSW